MQRPATLRVVEQPSYLDTYATRLLARAPNTLNLIYKMGRLDSQLIGDLLDRREVGLVLISLYTTEMIPREPYELRELLLGHEALRTVRPYALANVHDRYCKHLPVPQVVFIDQM